MRRTWPARSEARPRDVIPIATPRGHASWSARTASSRTVVSSDRTATASVRRASDGERAVLPMGSRLGGKPRHQGAARLERGEVVEPADVIITEEHLRHRPASGPLAQPRSCGVARGVDGLEGDAMPAEEPLRLPAPDAEPPLVHAHGLELLDVHVLNETWPRSARDTPIGVQSYARAKARAGAHGIVHTALTPVAARRRSSQATSRGATTATAVASASPATTSTA